MKDISLIKKMTVIRIMLLERMRAEMIAQTIVHEKFHILTLLVIQKMNRVTFKV